jgi:hypothetical protein
MDVIWKECVFDAANSGLDYDRPPADQEGVFLIRDGIKEKNHNKQHTES